MGFEITIAICNRYPDLPSTVIGAPDVYLLMLYYEKPSSILQPSHIKILFW